MAGATVGFASLGRIDYIALLSRRSAGLRPVLRQDVA
jgi:hypothetical protein